MPQHGNQVCSHVCNLPAFQPRSQPHGQLSKLPAHLHFADRK
jgi:hypothetical protein